jgi:hypothetical protein
MLEQRLAVGDPQLAGRGAAALAKSLLPTAYAYQLAALNVTTGASSPNASRITSSTRSQKTN